jgi:EAL domain-containing protein (putative c-di-GMP-specific phosphodiesterase class I)/GGDEF domain-containing protein/integral membrane sensor domain MASE1
MGKARTIRVRGRWRLFRAGKGRAEGPPPSAYVALYLFCLALSHWNAVRYGTIVIWPANGVALAALLQLHRRAAIAVLTVCFALNLAGNMLRGDVALMVAVNAALNFGEVLVAGLVARRFCGAALDLRRPVRLFRFVFYAATPTALLAALVGLSLLPFALENFFVSLQTWFTVDALSLILVTPPLLLLARRSRFAAADRGSALEKALLMGLLMAVTVGVFAQNAAPVLFLVFLPLLVVASRLSPVWAAASVLLIAFIGGAATLNGFGPITLSRVGPAAWGDANLLPVLSTLPIYQLFTAAVLCVALTASTILTERRRLEARLKTRTEAAVAARRRIAHLAAHDAETDLPNSIGLGQIAAGWIAAGGSGALHVGALIIDRFASIRAAIGSAQATQLLARTAAMITAELDGAQLALLASDTIGIAFRSSDPAEAQRVLHAALAVLDTPVAVGAERIDVRVTVGLAAYPGDATDAALLIRRALTACDQARLAGQPFARFDAQAERLAANGLTQLSELRASLDNQALFLAHQPKLDLRSGEISGVECLLRWNHPRHGLIPPDRFMPLVEETGFIEPLTAWVLARAIDDAAALGGRGIAINLSARSLANPALAVRLAAICAQRGFPSERITLEITETAVIADGAAALATLNALKQAGFRIAIDDYGTGLSSLAYLRQIPADCLKIDRCFVTHMADDARDAELVRATIDLAHRLGMRVVAEGVEDQRALDLLALFGCDEAQGYLIGRPVAIAEVGPLLQPWQLADQTESKRRLRRARG